MLIGEILERVQSLYSKGVASDDTSLSSRHIYNKILTVRSKLLSQQYDKKQRISQWNYQTIPCIELIDVNASECNCIEVNGCTLKRSKYKLPKPMQGLSNSIIQSVHSIDRGTKIDELSINSMKFQKGNKYTKVTTTYFIQDGYIYLNTTYDLKTISLIGLFEDPIEAKIFSGLCDECQDCNACIDYQDEEFPIDTDLIDTLIEMSITELIQLFSQSIQDTRNNSADDSNIIRAK